MTAFTTIVTLFSIACSACAAVHGKVTLNGAPKDPDVVLHIGSADPACGHAGKLTTENWKVGAGNGLAEAVVWVVGAPPAQPAGRAVMDQKGCRYEPHVLCVARGGIVTFKNSDSTLHTVIATRFDGKNENAPELFNIGQTAGVATDKGFDQAGIFQIKCAVHPWMSGWVIVTETHCFAVSGADGAFQLPELPDGAYTAQAWHSGFDKPLARNFTVKDGNATLDIEFNAAQANGKRAVF